MDVVREYMKINGFKVAEAGVRVQTLADVQLWWPLKEQRKKNRNIYNMSDGDRKLKSEEALGYVMSLNLSFH